jgi:hypothetical protein
MKCAHCQKSIDTSEKAVAHMGGCILNCGNHPACVNCAPLGYRLPYEQRAMQVFRAGDIVHVGPAYQSGGTYRSDGAEGCYTVLNRMGNDPDYKLGRGKWSSADVAEYSSHWDLMVHATRLIPEVK